MKKLLKTKDKYNNKFKRTSDAFGNYLMVDSVSLFVKNFYIKLLYKKYELKTKRNHLRKTWTGGANFMHLSGKKLNADFI